MTAPHLDFDEAHERAAAAWLARRDRKLNAAESAAFQQWLAEDARNGAALRELEDSFRVLDCLGEKAPASGAQPDRDLLLSQGTRTESATARKMIKFKAWIAATAAVAAAIAFVLILQRRSVSPELTVQPSTGTVVRHVARTIPLSDGSVIELKPGAQVEVKFEPAERRVHLVAGEAHFTVAKDASRPFVVSVDDLVVRAVGTAFNVRRGESSVEVLVTEGKVAVRDTAAANSFSTTSGDVPLVAGDRAVVAVDDGNRITVESVSSAESDRELAWRAVWLEFAEMRLGDVVNEFNRHNRRRLAVADESTGNVLVSGNFKADGADAFVRILESTFGITAHDETDVIVLKRK